MASQPPAPSRTGSVGPPSAGGMNAPPAGTPGGQNPNSQQNLNQIVSGPYLHRASRESISESGTSMSVPLNYNNNNMDPQRGLDTSTPTPQRMNRPYTSNVPTNQITAQNTIVGPGASPASRGARDPWNPGTSSSTPRVASFSRAQRRGKTVPTPQDSDSARAYRRSGDNMDPSYALDRSLSLPAARNTSSPPHPGLKYLLVGHPLRTELDSQRAAPLWLKDGSFSPVPAVTYVPAESLPQYGANASLARAQPPSSPMNAGISPQLRANPTPAGVQPRAGTVLTPPSPASSNYTNTAATNRATRIHPNALTNQAPREQVLEYLSKKGYSRTEAMLRRESAHTDANGHPILTRIEDEGGRVYHRCFNLLQEWIDNVLDIYKPELKRILWPIFVHAFLNLVVDCYQRDSQDYFNSFRKFFEREHEDDLRALQPISEPEHVQQNDIAQLYRNNKYRLSMSNMAFSTLIQFLESKEQEGGKVISTLINSFLDIRTLDRASTGGARGLAKLLAERNGEEDAPAEDEGIPGHHPGSANLDRNAPTVLSKLSLGPLPMEGDLMEDVKAELQDLDTSNPPATGQNSYSDEFEQRIKPEPHDDVPSREALPYPPSTARDVAMEVQKVKENRDRFRVEGRTGGVGPGVSVTMFTFHNTFDSINCMEFSGDNTLVAVGTAESYIRVWSLENRALTSPTDPPNHQPSSSRRLVGHSGPVYALSFSPSIAVPEPATNGHTTNHNSSSSTPRYMLSCSADATIRLWSLETWTNLVVYRSHQSPVWDVRFSPHGHYFVSSSADRSARLWSTPQIAPLRLFVGHDSDAETVAWHPNGAYVFTGSGGGDKTVRMWDIVRGTAVRLFTGHVGNVTALACAPNGHTIASADDRGEIIIWSLASGRLIKRMRGHGRGGIWSLDWSVESTVLVSGGADGTVRVWDVQANKEIGGKVVGEGGAGTKIDGSTVSGAPAKSKAKKDVVVSPDQISAFPTKKSPVYKVRFTQMNLVVAGGAYLP